MRKKSGYPKAKAGLKGAAGNKTRATQGKSTTNRRKIRNTAATKRKSKSTAYG